MISGNIHEKSNLAVLPEPLQRAVQFLKDNDLAAHEPGKFSTLLKELVNTGYIKISTGPGTWEKDIFKATTFVPILCEKV